MSERFNVIRHVHVIAAIYVLAGRLRIQVPSSEIRILYDALRYRYKSLTGILLLSYLSLTFVLLELES